MHLFALISSAALAGPGYFHPADIGAESEVFASTSEQLSEPFDALQDRAASLALALRQYRAALDLLGPAASQDERDRVTEIETQYNTDMAALQAFADALISDYDDHMVAAMERAVGSVAAGAVQCQREIPRGPSLPGMPTRMEPNPECTGTDLNANVARAMDADAVLAASLKEVMARPWPSFADLSETQPPTGGERHVHLHALVSRGAGDVLRRIDREDDERRFEANAMAEGTPTESERAAQVASLRSVAAETARRRSELAAPILAAGDAAAAKWTSKGGEPSTGWCANPVALGGCTGTDATDELVGRLLEDKKVAKALP